MTSYNASQIVDRHVESGRADKTAFIAADANLTYEQLRKQVNRAGGLLKELGVGREHRVLLVLDDTTAFPILFLGAMRIGAVPVPVSHLDKGDNFRHFVEDSYATVVATDAETLPRLQSELADHDLRYLVRGAEGAGVVELDGGLSAQSEELDPAPTHRDDMAFWLYSSGSTGKPKGVAHLHHDIETTCENYAGQVLGLRE
ncbi:MAG: AMP-binding protein, partial [Actinomycetota bacterium]|nr:AMP-binding protein [Actinomycetota bacterium]